MSQKKARFNIVDIIVVLILAAGIAFVGTRMLGSQEPAPSVSAPDSTYHVTFYAECVGESVAEYLVEGSAVENASRNMDLGTLEEFVVGESVWYTADSSGNGVQTTKPGYVSITLVCEVSGTETPTGLQVGQYTLNVGHEMGVCSGMAEVAVTVHSIAPVE